MLTLFFIKVNKKNMNKLYFSNNEIFSIDHVLGTIWKLRKNGNDYQFEYFCTMDLSSEIEKVYYFSNHLFIHTADHKLYCFNRKNKAKKENKFSNHIRILEEPIHSDNSIHENFVDDNIDNCLLSEKNGNLFYQKDNKIYLIVQGKTPYDLLNLSFCVELVENKSYSKYLIVFPFEIKNIRFLDNVIEFETNGMKNIIIPDTLKWIYYQNNLNHSNYKYIYNKLTPVIFLKTENKIYSIGIGIKLVEQDFNDIAVSDDKFILKNSNNITVFHKNDDIETIVDSFSKYFINVVGKCYILDITDETNTKVNASFFVKDSQDYFNVSKMKQYLITNDSIVGISHSNVLHYYYIEKQISSSYYLDDDVIFHKIADNTILIEKNGKYYILDQGTRKVINYKFETIQSVYDNNYYDNMYSFIIECSIDKLDQFLNLCSHFPINELTRINISYTSMKEYISSGDGTTRDFFDDISKQLLSKYFISESSFTRFNKEEINKLTEYQARNLGFLINVVLYNNGKFNFHFPLNFLELLTGEKVKGYEMELFIQEREPEIYNSLLKIKEHPDKIKELGYEKYLDCLKQLCRYEEIDSNGILDHIKCGFFDYYISEYFKINSITTDAVLTETRINVDDILNNLTISENKKIDGFKEKFETFVKKLTKEELKILLKNWTGSSRIFKNEFQISFLEDPDVDIKFSTCCSLLQINIKMLDNYDILFDTLKVPYLVMVD
jgi:hypothetical protein